MNARTLRNSASTLLLAALVLLACPNSKADQVYTTLAAFNAASTGQTTIAFTGLAGPTHGFGLQGQPLTTGGATFTVPDGPGAVLDPQFIYILAPLYGDGDYLIADDGAPDTIHITLPGSTAVGFNVGGVLGDPGSITVQLSDGKTEVISGTSGEYITAGSLDFIGFTSATPITSVNIVYKPGLVSTSFGAVDNFAYGTFVPPTVPEPGSLLMVGTGLISAAAAFRRRIFRV